jgi:hypothetical protein
MKPWETELTIWIAYCDEKLFNYLSSHVRESFLEMKTLKEEYEWFRKGYLSRECK